MKLPFDFSIKLIFRLVFPGFILAAALVPAVQALLHVSGLNIKFEYLFAIEVVALGWLVVVNDMTIYMIFEGRRYWLRPIRDLLIWCQKRRLGRLSEIVANPPPRNTDRRRYSEAAVEYALYPVNNGGEPYVASPTRLGNIIKSFEEYPNVKYGLDSVFYWYRLWVVLDKDLREEIDSAQAVVDSTVYISFVSYVSGLVMLVYAGLGTAAGQFTWLSQIKLPYVPSPSALCFMGLGCLIIGYVIYWLSFPAHAQFGELFKSVFDQYRSKLVFDDVLDDIGCIMGDPTITLKSSQRDKNEIVWRYLRWHLIRDELSGRNLTVKQWEELMTISDDNRRQFELIGEDQLAFALATGTLQSLGMTEDKKQEALKWIAERRKKRAEEDALAATERKQTLQWAKIAGWWAIIGVGVSIAAIIVSIWLRK